MTPIPDSMRGNLRRYDGETNEKPTAASLSGGATWGLIAALEYLGHDVKHTAT